MAVLVILITFISTTSIAAGYVPLL
jgi:hypothetical protein